METEKTEFFLEDANGVQHRFVTDDIQKVLKHFHENQPIAYPDERQQKQLDKLRAKYKRQQLTENKPADKKD